MRADWVAASVRARSMAARRVGAGTSREIAAAPDLETALNRLADTGYGAELETTSTLPEAHQSTRRTVLWQLRVLAGWLPAGGARLVRAAAAVFEADNILALDLQLRRGQSAPDKDTSGKDTATKGTATRDTTGGRIPGDVRFFDLGGLATAWPRIRTATTVQGLRSTLASSPWGDPGPDAALSDVLTVVWLRRLTAEAAAVRPWAASASALLCARLTLVNRSAPADRLLTLLRPLVGTGWPGAENPEALRAVLPPGTTKALDGVQLSTDLWRAEAALAARVEADGFSLLRAGLPGPEIVLGAMAVLAVDAWRVRAALAAAAAGTGNSEVLDAVA